jgi:DNA (cytosine-5)-methyltransferase 1
MKRDPYTIPLSWGNELIIDNFAGGGGTSTGLEQAFGRPVDIAINHNAEALTMHAVNHPHTKHLCESVWDVDPIKVTNNQPVGLVWLSPDCKHFSKAKGGKPVEKKIRGLAWVTLRWAAKCKPRVIMLENVEEFKTWGPLLIDEHGNAKPDPAKKGQTFDSFVRQLKAHGYEVDYREFRACDYGTPTIRKRFFLVARRDGIKIQWPAATHGAPDSVGVKSGKLQAYRTAADCIDWSIPCPSIFERKKVLADATLRRIAKGIMRYVINAADPFIIGQGGPIYSGKPVSVGQPFGTLTTENHRSVVVPSIVPIAHYNGRDTAHDAAAPLSTITAHPKGGSHALVSAFLAKHYTGVVGSGIQDSIGTVTSIDHHSLVTAHIQRDMGQSIGHAADAPLATTTAGGGGHSALVTSNLIKLRGDNVGQAVDSPLATISAGGQHHAEVRAFLLSYYGSEKDADSIDSPTRTVTSRDRFGLVTIKGQDYQIIDIGLRMLAPRELFRAQGFPDTYIIGDNPEQGLILTKSAQVRMCGNSVCPPMAFALIQANFKHEQQFSKVAA